MADHITRYDKMPIPPIAAHTEYFDAGVIRIGVEYRVLTDAVVSAIRATLEGAQGDETGRLENLDDSGVSLHVFGGLGAEKLEYLRFDCFQEEPHYHYVGWSKKSNELLHIDPVADGDALVWALERIRTRLPQMLIRASAPEIAEKVDVVAVETVLPRVAEAAYRARYRSDANQVRIRSEQKAE
jgi:hypothetical protein